ncbi:hypothetical protein [Williamsia sp. 1135]|uniref:hypothetical protein n=1 Tax=Williamsia sp. 1135 TaxID=1889262 RepID=UPI001F0AC1E1|nr:hypothetical protein [Williamsia sp. 1135]
MSEDAVGPGQIQVIAEAGAQSELTPAGLPRIEAVRERASIIAAINGAVADESLTRLVVVAGPELPDAFCAAVVGRIMLAERLDLEIALVLPHPTPASTIYGLPTGPAATALAVDGAAEELPLIRDDMAIVLLGQARQRGVEGPFDGESYVDSELLVRGKAKAVVVEPTATMPGVRARLDKRFRAKWHLGRAAQTGAPALIVERDGITAPRPTKRSTFYRHQHNWKLVRP